MPERAFDDIGPVVLIGAGKMGLALARGWLSGGLPTDRLVLVDPFAADLVKEFAAQNGVRLLKSIANVLTHVLVLAVKPQTMGEALAQVKPAVGKQTLVISIAAGVSLKTLSAALAPSGSSAACPTRRRRVGGHHRRGGLKIGDADAGRRERCSALQAPWCGSKPRASSTR